ncbi:MAG: hypothetical protein ACRCSN_19825 [Dermatophilaceae bacterium]
MRTRVFDWFCWVALATLVGLAFTLAGRVQGWNVPQWGDLVAPTDLEDFDLNRGPVVEP